jgi:hypothetical protein
MKIFVEKAVKKDKKPPTYPYIGRFFKTRTDEYNRDAEHIVLFCAATTGTVLQSSNIPLGYYSSSWTEKDFEPFYGTITLTTVEE